MSAVGDRWGRGNGMCKHRAARRRVVQCTDSIGFRRVVILVSFRCQEMHECGIMHRDLSPWNIFLSDANDVRVGDLGLGAEVRSHNTHRT